jgi:hypothetical protein
MLEEQKLLLDSVITQWHVSTPLICECRRNDSGRIFEIGVKERENTEERKHISCTQDTTVAACDLIQSLSPHNKTKDTGFIMHK